MLDIVLNNGATTPVAKTFAFVMQENGSFSYQDTTAGTYEGYNLLNIRVRPSTAKNMGHKVSVTISVPKLAVTAPASGSGIQPNPVAAYVTAFRGEFMLPKASDLDNRKDVMAFAQNLFALTAFKNLVLNLTAPQ